MTKLPIYNAFVTDSAEGIVRISLVDFPAVESNWVAFNKEQKKLSYSIENEDERMILGVVMRADFPIYRRDDDGYEYYIMYDKDTIKTMAEKLMVDGYQNRIDTMHNGNEVDGVNLLQLFIKDTEKGINPTNFEDIEDGSLFAQYKVENDEIWEKVKDGTFQGFSLEGYFTVEKQNKLEKNNKSIMSKLKDMVAKILAQFGEVATDKGTLVWEGEADLKEGDIVTLEDGNQPEDGEYKTEDGKVITIEEGKVAKIEDGEAEVAPEQEQEMEAESEAKQKFNAVKAQFEASYQEVEQNIYSALSAIGSWGYLIENGDDYAIVSEWGMDDREHLYRYEISIAEDGTVTLGAKKEVKVEYVDADEAQEEPAQEVEMEAQEEPAQEEPAQEDETKSEIDALKEEIETLKADLEAVKESLADIVEKPAVEPIAQEFEKVTEISTGNAKLDKVCKRVASLRK